MGKKYRTDRKITPACSSHIRAIKQAKTIQELDLIKRNADLAYKQNRISLKTICFLDRFVERKLNQLSYSRY